MSSRDYTTFRPPVARFGDRGAAAPLRIAFLIGSTDISGGTYVILQHILEAEDRGDEVTVVPFFPPTAESVRWHPAFERLRLAKIDELAGERFDLALATWWRTVYELDRVDATHYAYFVQSVESRFYEEDDPRAARFADASYDLPLPVITETPWIQWYLAFTHQRPSFLVPNGIDKGLFTPVGPRTVESSSAGLRVLVEGPLGVPMKNVEQTIDLVKQSGVADTWLLTSSNVAAVDGVERVFSRIPITATPAVYRSCDVIVKLSLVEGMFGPPLEMFHCGGTAICWDVTGHEDYVRNGENGLVVACHDLEATLEAIRYLAAEPFELARLRRGALRTAARWPSWKDSSARFHDALQVIVRQPEADLEDAWRRTAAGRASLG